MVIALCTSISRLAVRLGGMCVTLEKTSNVEYLSKNMTYTPYFFAGIVI